MECRVALAGREHDEDVVGVGVHGGYKAPGAHDAGLAQDVVVGGLAVEGGVAVAQAVLHGSGVVLDYHEREAVHGELGGDLLAHPAVAADDVVPAHFADLGLIRLLLK